MITKQYLIVEVIMSKFMSSTNVVLSAS